jgi:N-methylhydantoinase A
MHAAAPVRGSRKIKPDGARPMLFAGWTRHRSCAVYSRYDMGPGKAVAGPAVIEEAESTTVIGPGAKAVIDTKGNIVILLHGKVRG